MYLQGLLGSGERKSVELRAWRPETSSSLTASSPSRPSAVSRWRRSWSRPRTGSSEGRRPCLGLDDTPL